MTHGREGARQLLADGIRRDGDGNVAGRLGPVADRWIPETLRADVDLHRRARLLLGLSLVPLPACFTFALLYLLILPREVLPWLLVPVLVPVPFCLAVAPVLRRSGSLALPLRMIVASALGMLCGIAVASGGSVSHARSGR
jgi:hypothetical protein